MAVWKLDKFYGAFPFIGSHIFCDGFGDVDAGCNCILGGVHSHFTANEFNKTFFCHALHL